MDEMGVKITGYLSGMDSKVSEFDGVKKVVYRYLVVAGMDSYIVTSDVDYNGAIQLQDLVTFKVFPSAFNGKIYYKSGKLV
jgi:hypothetical protein